ncbi:MAG: YheT family hydrolase [Acidithiobacillus sp.]|uniref:YheT family hydrolase n=1 Tax=Acidithiobacillus sp. TaxID=1872118 RepID=UPI003D06807F
MNPPPCAFRPPRWLPDGHWETLWAPFLARAPRPRYRREIWTTPDADRLAVDWVDGRDDRPVVALFHGLASSSRGHYARAFADRLQRQGWTGALVNFRGCGGLDNLRPRAYHAGDSAELRWILAALAERFPERPLFAAGVSLGGNVLLKYLGEEGRATPLRAAAAICAPIDLTATATYLDAPQNRVYAAFFLRTLKASMGRYRRRFPQMADWQAVRRARSLRAFDDAFTAPVHGFADAASFWRESSAGPLLKNISVPTWLLHSANDPIVPIDSVRSWAISSQVIPCVTDGGGHVGFVSGKLPGHLYWLAESLIAFFEGQWRHEQG